MSTPPSLTKYHEKSRKTEKLLCVSVFTCLWYVIRTAALVPMPCVWHVDDDMTLHHWRSIAIAYQCNDWMTCSWIMLKIGLPATPAHTLIGPLRCIYVLWDVLIDLVSEHRTWQHWSPCLMPYLLWIQTKITNFPDCFHWFRGSAGLIRPVSDVFQLWKVGWIFMRCDVTAKYCHAFRGL